MDDFPEYLYIKFRLNNDLDMADAFFISEDKDRVDRWQADRESESSPENDTDPAVKNAFRDISKEFEKSIEEFQTTVPFIMQMMPFLLRSLEDRSIRQFVKRHGESLKEGAFETYRIGIDHIVEINKRLQRVTAISKGVDSLPSMFLVGLISAYDVFLSDLIHLIFTVKPELLSSSERNISFKDLVEIGSVEAARERIIEKEVETQIRKSHADQVEWLSSKLDVPLTKELKIWPDFIELCERRNLLAHTGGIISSQYIGICNKYGISTLDMVVGKKLEITSQYYSHAVETILEFGMKLIQVIWRKLVPADINTIDAELGEFGYRLIARRRYRAAATMLSFGLYEMKKHGTEAIRKMMVVNYANAEKLSGDKAAAEKILDAEDWSASTEDYRICVAAVKDDTETVIRTMKHVVESGRMKIRSFREWPVFENIRKEPTLVEAFEKDFGEKLLLDRETTNRQTAGAGNDVDDDSVEGVSDADKPENNSTIH